MPFASVCRQDWVHFFKDNNIKVNLKLIYLLISSVRDPFDRFQYNPYFSFQISLSLKMEPWSCSLVILIYTGNILKKIDHVRQMFQWRLTNFTTLKKSQEACHPSFKHYFSPSWRVFRSSHLSHSVRALIYLPRKQCFSAIENTAENWNDFMERIGQINSDSLVPDLYHRCFTSHRPVRLVVAQLVYFRKRQKELSSDMSSNSPESIRFPSPFAHPQFRIVQHECSKIERLWSLDDNKLREALLVYESYGLGNVLPATARRRSTNTAKESLFTDIIWFPPSISNQI